MSTKEAQRRASAKYDATHTRFYGFKLNEGTDKDIIEYLDSVPNKQQAFKEAIRKMIEGGK